MVTEERCGKCGVLQTLGTPKLVQPGETLDRAPFVLRLYGCEYCKGVVTVLKRTNESSTRGSTKPLLLFPPFSADLTKVTKRQTTCCNRCGRMPGGYRLVIKVGSGRSGRTVILCRADAMAYLLAVALFCEKSVTAIEQTTTLFNQDLRRQYRDTVEDVYLVDRRPASKKKTT
jgi:hypothetical protein